MSEHFRSETEKYDVHKGIWNQTHHATAPLRGQSASMIRIFREPEVVVRFGGDPIVQCASELDLGSFADVVQVEAPIADSFWLFRPQMNGYNVHDGVSGEPPFADL